ncbi:RusA family crossover junction endodeoxyribonuclease [Leucobacter viscericola]|uniref:RusA family crossover junction endodeoxyribonuclease n=1 Tax=Leucobacter viscericola TaxID=2714935 RepID=A0A6G7XHM5_9MICO|nr:RusA family crossover junction endodeoxyribonuclease [Leucobacter viscericola]QIK64114.1 RusA family crossover junction endodeoxyribonuclease [Leucobacter viscericola]
MITFRVDGVPVPQGSKTVAQGGGKAWLRDANGAKLKPWRALVQSVAEAALLEAGGVGFDCPVELHVTFFMPRPKKPKFHLPATKPDIDKLLRAVMDALTKSGVIRDDSRVTAVSMYESFTDDLNPAGVDVSVFEDRRER